MAQSIINSNEFARKMDENHLSSSPRRTAIRKSSLRLSIPTIEQINESKKPIISNQNDSDDFNSDSYVKRMINNCNYSGQLQSNINSKLNNDNESNNGNSSEDLCDIKRLKCVINAPKLEKSKQINLSNSKTPTDFKVIIDSDENETIKMPQFTQLKSISLSTPSTPLHPTKPYLKRIVSLSPTIHYNLDQHVSYLLLLQPVLINCHLLKNKILSSL